MWFARVLLMFTGLALGWLAGLALGRGVEVQGTVSRINTLSLMLAGTLIAVLIAPRFERWLARQLSIFNRWYDGLSPRLVGAATTGLVIALLLSVLLANLMRGLPFYSWVMSITVTLLLSVFFVGFAVQNADTFGILALPQVKRKGNAKILDSNVIIDGRVVELARSGFLEGDLVIPAFVLRELQLLADHTDPQRRVRGKRGLGVLEELQELRQLHIEDWDDPNLGQVDDKLVRLARESGAKLLTNDSNLSKIAKLNGLTVLSVNELAVALKPQVQTGTSLTLMIAKNGQQAGQGVGYLEDGTMVVVEDGSRMRGKVARVQVVNNVQTNVGRMIFARLDEDGGALSGT